MANAELGEVGFEAAGKKYIWIFSVGAMIALEEHLDRGIIDITEELQSWLPPFEMIDGKAVPKAETPEQIKARNSKMRLGFCRSLFWSGLQDHHSEIDIKAAGEVMKALGGMVPTLGVILKGVGLSKVEEGEAAAVANPRKRPRAAKS
jgi:hypothetical protein